MTWLKLCVLAGVLTGCAAAPCPRCPSVPPAPPPPAPCPSVAAPAPPAPSATAAENVAPPPINDAIAGWFPNGSERGSYRITRDREVKHGGASSVRVDSVRPVPVGFGGIMQSLDATAYRGKRVRFTAQVKTHDVARWAGLWMRIDRPGEHSAAFDNMADRPIRGTTDWATYVVVLDVAKDASTLSYGMLVDGSGSAWLDDAKLEIVDAKVPVTGAGSGLPKQPVNLGFEE